MALPLLRTADLLITQCGLCELVPIQHSPSDAQPAPVTALQTAAAAEAQLLALVEAVKGEARSCADVGRLLAATEVLCHAAGAGGAVRVAALAPVMVLLCSRYPKVTSCWLAPAPQHVQPQHQCRFQLQRRAWRALELSARRCTSGRQFVSWTALAAGGPADVASAMPLQVRKHAAEQLYLQLLGEDDANGALDPVLDTLSGAAWDGDLAAARAARATLFAPLGLQPPQPAGQKQARGLSPAPGPAGGLTYASLITSAARGG